MFIVLGVMLSGILVGYLLRKVKNIRFLDKLISIFIFLLLFFLGVSVGHNDTVINSFSTIAVQAIIITFGAVFGSVLMAWVIYKRFYENK